MRIGPRQLARFVTVPSPDQDGPARRVLAGTVTALVTMAVLTIAMLPLRAHLSIATTALVLVVPVVIGVVVGGFVAGVLSVIAGFLVYDYFFIPPYLTLYVGRAQNWAALGVYVLVMLPVARVVAGMNVARAKERRQRTELRQLFELSDLLVEDKPLDVLLPSIVTALTDVFGSRQVAIFLPAGEKLELAASAGEPLSAGQLRQVLPGHGTPRRLGPQSGEQGDLLVLALTAAGRPVGLLALSADSAVTYEREPLMLFANQIALAVERSQLREQALRTRLTEEVVRLARMLVAAVAHDLRSPLATIKASSSTLADTEIELRAEVSQSLAKLIDVQADRLSDLVANLLDMSRIQAGVLEPCRSVTTVTALVDALVADLTSALRGHEVRIEMAKDLPPVDVDVVLISRVLTNLLENAIRHSPPGAPITVGAQPVEDAVEVSVTDQGPGVSPDRRDEIFGFFARRVGDTGAGLGLAIAKTFIEAHGQQIWVEAGPTGGARFCCTLPVAAAISEEARIAASAHH
jgi:two-component system, OmpR family, sensor histidine kinase KdpD